MKRAILLVTGLIILCMLFSGCTSGPRPGTRAGNDGRDNDLHSGPHDHSGSRDPCNGKSRYNEDRVVPPAQSVNLELTKDRPTSEIHLLYQGGPGDVFTQKIFMWVYSSDVDYKEYIMKDGNRPIPGDEIVAPGTRGSDRCVVFVVSGGVTYKVMDQEVVLGRY